MPSSATPSQRLVRHADWPQRLALFVEQRRATPFAWGAQDCCTFACDAVVHMTGADPMASLRHIATATAARRLLKRIPLPILAAQHLGPMQTTAMAQRGDLLLLEQRGQHLLGVCLGHQWAAPGHHGLVFGPMDGALGAWPIGRAE